VEPPVDLAAATVEVLGAPFEQLGDTRAVPTLVRVCDVARVRVLLLQALGVPHGLDHRRAAGTRRGEVPVQPRAVLGTPCRARPPSADERLGCGSPPEVSIE